MQRLVIGDIHGNLTGLNKILNIVDYTPKKYKLIFVGDYIDGIPDNDLNIKGVIERLVNLKNAHFVLGNHDLWMIRWIKSNSKFPKPLWHYQGGRETLKSYGISESNLAMYSMVKKNIPKSHVQFLFDLKPRYMDNEIIVVHGGFENITDLHVAFDGKETTCDMLWDREFFHKKIPNWFQDEYRNVFGERTCICGHSPTRLAPVVSENPYRLMIDGGSKGGGQLTAVILNDAGRMIRIIRENEGIEEVGKGA